MKKYSIIIPTYNKADYLDIVLNSLCLVRNISDCEIVVVNDGSSDNTHNIVCQFKNRLFINYIYQDNKGLAAARNRGIKACQGKIIFFMDDDRSVLPDFLEIHLYLHNTHQEQEIIGVGDSKQLFISNIKYKKDDLLRDIKIGLPFYNKLAREDDYRKVIRKMFHNHISNYPIQWIACLFCNLSVKKSMLDQTVLFDSSFTGWGCEDLEFGYRLVMQRNARIYYLDKAICYHLEHPRSPQMMKDFKRNFTYMYNKHKTLELLLFKEFVAGKISLERYNDSVIAGRLLPESNTSENTFYKDTNVFRNERI